MKTGKEQIIDAAMSVIGREGVDACSLRAIAREAGVSTGAIYHYFGSREEVMYAVMEKSLREAQRVSRRAAQHHPPGEAVLSDVLDGLRRRFQKTSENMIQLTLLAEACLKDSPLKEAFRAKYRQWSDEISLLIRYVYDCEDNAMTRALGDFMLAGIEGVAIRLLLDERAAAPESILRVYEYMLRQGLPAALAALAQGEDDAREQSRTE